MYQIYKLVFATTHPQHIIHQSALPRPNLHQLNPTPLPTLRHLVRNSPDSHKLAKDLGDLGGRNKVAMFAEDISPRSVVSALRRGQDLAHECCDWDGPVT